MFHVLNRTMVLVIMLLFTGYSWTQAQETTPTPQPPLSSGGLLRNMGQEEITILDSINLLRLGNNLVHLVPNATLNTVANRQLNDLLSRPADNLGDISVNNQGKRIAEWLENASFPAYSDGYVATVIPYIVTDLTPELVVNFWNTQQDGSRLDIMLNDDYREIGIAYAQNSVTGRHYYVIIFASRPSVLPVIVAEREQTRRHLLLPNIRTLEVTIYIHNENSHLNGDSGEDGTAYIGYITDIHISESDVTHDCEAIINGQIEGSQPYLNQISYTLPPGLGQRTIYVQLCDAVGRTITMSTTFNLQNDTLPTNTETATFTSEPALITYTSTATATPSLTPTSTHDINAIVFATQTQAAADTQTAAAPMTDTAAAASQEQVIVQILTETAAVAVRLPSTPTSVLPSDTPNVTPIPPSPTATPSPTFTETSSPTATPSQTPTETSTATGTSTETPTPTPTPSATLTETPTETSTFTDFPTETASPTPTTSGFVIHTRIDLVWERNFLVMTNSNPFPVNIGGLSLSVNGAALIETDTWQARGVNTNVVETRECIVVFYGEQPAFEEINRVSFCSEIMGIVEVDADNAVWAQTGLPNFNVEFGQQVLRACTPSETIRCSFDLLGIGTAQLLDQTDYIPVQVDWDGAAFAIINTSDLVVDASALVFQNDYSRFAWRDYIDPAALDRLEAGKCLIAASIFNQNPSLPEGTHCQIEDGIAQIDPANMFWLREQTSFTVYINGVIAGVCNTEESPCEIAAQRTH